MKSNDLLSHISELELKLNSFSFDQLTSEEANRIKKSFLNFKKNLENKTTLDAKSKLLSTDFDKKSITIKDTEALVIARVSHEIRTPLNGIIGFTDLLLEDALSEDQFSNVNAIKTASNTLLKIINELLEYSKITSGNVYVESIDFNIHHLIKDVCYLCKTLIVNEDVSFTYSISENTPFSLVGDPSKLSQILLNLLGNAIKFVDKGTIALHIEAKNLKNDTLTLNFILKDTGIGIAENSIGTIFDYYQQADPNISKKYGGTGLGLGIVKHLIDSLDGSIKVTSKVGIGTTFNFSIPYKINTNSIAETNVIKTQNKETETQLKDISILVFEDNTMNQKLIKNRLESWGCKPFITDDVKEGLWVLQTNKIDLILMDLQLPETTGFVIAKMIRQNKDLKIGSVPIIALTADFSVKDEDLCKKSGINDYVLKPFKADELLHKIKIAITDDPMNKSTMSHPIISKINQEEAPDVNLMPLYDECLQDASILEELIQLFKNNMVEFIGKTKLDLKNLDIEGIRFSTHKIKASLRMLHSNGLFRIVEQMHKTCDEDRDFKYLNFLYDCFISEYPRIENAIEESLLELKNSKK